MLPTVRQHIRVRLVRPPQRNADDIPPIPGIMGFGPEGELALTRDLLLRYPPTSSCPTCMNPGDGPLVQPVGGRTLGVPPLTPWKTATPRDPRQSAAAYLNAERAHQGVVNPWELPGLNYLSPGHLEYAVAPNFQNEFVRLPHNYLPFLQEAAKQPANALVPWVEDYFNRRNKPLPAGGAAAVARFLTAGSPARTNLETAYLKYIETTGGDVQAAGNVAQQGMQAIQKARHDAVAAQQQSTLLALDSSLNQLASTARQLYDTDYAKQVAADEAAKFHRTIKAYLDNAATQAVAVKQRFTCGSCKTNESSADYILRMWKESGATYPWNLPGLQNLDPKLAELSGFDVGHLVKNATADPEAWIRMLAAESKDRVPLVDLVTMPKGTLEAIAGSGPMALINLQRIQGIPSKELEKLVGVGGYHLISLGWPTQLRNAYNWVNGIQETPTAIEGMAARIAGDAYKLGLRKTLNPPPAALNAYRTALTRECGGLDVLQSCLPSIDREVRRDQAEAKAAIEDKLNKSIPLAVDRAVKDTKNALSGFGAFWDSLSGPMKLLAIGGVVFAGGWATLSILRGRR